MDVNVILARLRELAARYDAPFPDLEESAEAGEELADLFGSLDEWLSRGGFLPSEWNANRS